MRRIRTNPVPSARSTIEQLSPHVPTTIHSRAVSDRPGSLAAESLTSPQLYSVEVWPGPNGRAESASCGVPCESVNREDREPTERLALRLRWVSKLVDLQPNQRSTHRFHGPRQQSQECDKQPRLACNNLRVETPKVFETSATSTSNHNIHVWNSMNQFQGLGNFFRRPVTLYANRYDHNSQLVASVE
jgi:hypothetical protein